MLTATDVVLTTKRALEHLRRDHLYCEDGFYACPKNEEYMGNDKSGRCDCGADDDNLIIDVAVSLADEFLQQESS